MKVYALGVHTVELCFFCFGLDGFNVARCGHRRHIVPYLPRSGDREDARAFVFLLWPGRV